MVSAQSVYDQLKRLNIKYDGWGRTELRELPQVLMPGEEMYECVNGYYDAGFALLVATNYRVLLIDKKPLSYLTVEDLRFDMINELDYSHRLIGAQISISAGGDLLTFRSFNKFRLRKLLNHVQHSMAEAKKQHQMQQEGQNLHLQNINEQLQLYLLMQQGHERELTKRLLEAQERYGHLVPNTPTVSEIPEPNKELLRELAADGSAEVFGKAFTPEDRKNVDVKPIVASDGSVYLDPKRTAFTRIPLSVRNRYFGRAARLASGITDAAETVA